MGPTAGLGSRKAYCCRSLFSYTLPVTTSSPSPSRNFRNRLSFFSDTLTLASEGSTHAGPFLLEEATGKVEGVGTAAFEGDSSRLLASSSSVAMGSSSREASSFRPPNSSASGRSSASSSPPCVPLALLLDGSPESKKNSWGRLFERVAIR